MYGVIKKAFILAAAIAAAQSGEAKPDSEHDCVTATDAYAKQMQHDPIGAITQISAHPEALCPFSSAPSQPIDLAFFGADWQRVLPQLCDGSRVNMVHNGLTPLAHVILTNAFDFDIHRLRVEMLIRQGAEITSDDPGTDALSAAYSTGDRQLINYLKRKAGVDGVRRKDAWAARERHANLLADEDLLRYDFANEYIARQRGKVLTLAQCNITMGMLLQYDSVDTFTRLTPSSQSSPLRYRTPDGKIEAFPPGFYIAETDSTWLIEAAKHGAGKIVVKMLQATFKQLSSVTMGKEERTVTRNALAHRDGSNGRNFWHYAAENLDPKDASRAASFILKPGMPCKDIVGARDTTGDTALDIAKRDGDRGMIRVIRRVSSLATKAKCAADSVATMQRSRGTASSNAPQQTAGVLYQMLAKESVGANATDSESTLGQPQ